MNSHTGYRPRRKGGGSHGAFGSQRERQVADRLRADGWVVFRSSGSFGVCDLVACRQQPTQPDRFGQMYSEVRMVEVKGTTRSPWVAWGPKERVALLDAARQAGATPLLAWWPPHGELQWLGASEWPS